MKEKLLVAIIWLLATGSWAQSNPPASSQPKHFIYFKDKASTPYSTTNPAPFLSAAAIARRQRYQIPVITRDLPVNPAYTAQLKAQGATVWYTSRWFNGALVQCDSATYRQLQQLPFVKNTQTLSRQGGRKSRRQGQQQILSSTNIEKRQPEEPQNYGEAYAQARLIGAPAMHAAGFRGQGMRIAVFDGGFAGLNRIAAFSHLFRENKIIATYDFVDRNTGVIEKDSHGTEVLSTMAANQPGVYLGTAPAADYALFITEDVNREQRLEEINWLLAAEFADSAGIDIIQSSLGYNTFDQPTESYTYADMNGNRALVSRAADFAAAAGMLVVVSAGNEGNDPWRYITAPADADSVLSVGATDSLGRRAAFSSLGPTADQRIKPEVAGQGLLAAVINPAGAVIRANGTSFSAPIICGLAAGFWQANRYLTNLQVIAYLKQSASQAQNPDNRLGYGIPVFAKAQLLVEAASMQSAAGYKLFPNPVSAETNYSFTLLLPVTGSQPIDIRIVNAVGQEIRNFTYQHHQLPTNHYFLRVQVDHLAAGMYHCLINQANHSETIRFVKH